MGEELPTQFDGIRKIKVEPMQAAIVEPLQACIESSADLGHSAVRTAAKKSLDPLIKGGAGPLFRSRLPARARAAGPLFGIDVARVLVQAM